MSVLSLAAIGAIWWLFTEKGARSALAPEGSAQLSPAWAVAAQEQRTQREAKAERKRKKKR